MPPAPHGSQLPTNLDQQSKIFNQIDLGYNTAHAFPSGDRIPALERILLKVQKPGRYVGGELNAVVKDWDKIETKVAFVFPDIYDIGISNLGLQILYDLVNQRPDALAERAYAPWVDMEDADAREGTFRFTRWRSKHPLAAFDILGFSLPYETLYTNTLNLLDLAGIPLRSAERDAIRPVWSSPGGMPVSTRSRCTPSSTPL